MIRGIIKMSITDLLRRKKSSLINIFIITLSILAILIIITLSNTLSNFIQNNIDKNIQYRTMFVKYDVMNESIDSVMSNVKHIDHVHMVLEQQKYKTYVSVDEFKTKKTDGEIQLISSDKDMVPQIVAGRNMKDNEKNVMICPYNFVADSNVDNRTDLYRTDYIDGKRYLDKDIIISYNSYDESLEIPKILETFTKKFKIIGLYDSYDNFSGENICYAPFSSVDEISENIENNTSNEYEIFFHPVVIVDDSKNVDKVFNDIKNLGYNPVKTMNIDIKTTQYIKSIGFILVIATSTVSFICILIFVYKAIRDRKSEIGILKAIGYKNKYIYIFFVVETIILGIVSILIALLIYTSLYFFAYYVTHYAGIVWSRFIIKYEYTCIVLVLTCIIIIPVICSSIFYRKIRNINPIEILNK